MEKSQGGMVRSIAAIVGPALPVLVGVVLTILLTISPQDASRNFTAWGDAFSGVLAGWFQRGGTLHPATAKAWFNPGVIVVLIGIGVSLTTGFVSAWVQLRETRKHAAAMFADAIHGELLAKLTATHPSAGDQAD